MVHLGHVTIFCKIQGKKLYRKNEKLSIIYYSPLRRITPGPILPTLGETTSDALIFFLAILGAV